MLESKLSLEERHKRLYVELSKAETFNGDHIAYSSNWQINISKRFGLAFRYSKLNRRIDSEGFQCEIYVTFGAYIARNVELKCEASNACVQYVKGKFRRFKEGFSGFSPIVYVFNVQTDDKTVEKFVSGHGTYIRSEMKRLESLAMRYNE